MAAACDSARILKAGKQLFTNADSHAGITNGDPNSQV
jgi:hypothetical protein